MAQQKSKTPVGDKVTVIIQTDPEAMNRFKAKVAAGELKEFGITEVSELSDEEFQQLTKNWVFQEDERRAKKDDPEARSR